MNDCVSVTRSSPTVVIRSPVIGTTTSPPNIDIKNIAAVTHEEFGSHNCSKGKEPHLPLSSDGKEGFLGTSRLSCHTETNNHICVTLSSTNEDLSNKPLLKDAVDHRPKARSGFQVPDITVPDGIAIAFDGTGFKSSENSSESLDSPCWKGAPGFNFSPFEVFEASAKQSRPKKIEVGLNLQGTQSFPHASFPKSFENSLHNQNGHIDNGMSLFPQITPDTNCLVKEHRSGDAVKAGDQCPKLDDGIGVLSSDLPYESKGECNTKPSHSAKESHEEEDFTCTKLKLCAGVAETLMNTNDASEDGHVPFHVVENVLSSSPSSGEDATNLAKPHVMESTPKMGIQFVVNVMHDLSELLLFCCSNDMWGLKKQDCEALQHVINRLDACRSRRIINVMPPQESLCPQQGAFHEVPESTDLHMGASGSQPRVTNEAAANWHGALDFQHMYEKKRGKNVSGKKVEKFPDFVSSRDEEVSKDDNMIQAIKKILDENFHDKEEGQSPTLLYKNLWLEAEAELCSIRYRARLDRMKIRMDKSKSDTEKCVSENTTVEEQHSSVEVFPNPNMPSTLRSEAKESPSLKDPIQDFPSSSSTSHVDDVEASVMTRFNILKCRDDNTNSINRAEQPQAKESPSLKDPIQDFPSSSSTSHVDEVEASVMARFNILKCRDDNTNSINRAEQPLPEVGDTGFAGKRNHWPFTEYQSKDGCLDLAVGPHLEHETGNGSGDKFGSYRDGSEHLIVREFRACVKDDSVIQSHMNNKLADQFFAGWYDNSASDWENVLKDEFALPK
ncbi:unnamed protein product [Ilex paraguariensis]|uniref:Uncharacterized protein n=1 Tax=Ilex paraguariensis TaxID=185542 RepID=A0ABC8R4R4_9AQUA